MTGSKPATGEIIAALSGIALLVAMFLPWYGVDVQVAEVALSQSANAWEMLVLVDLLLFAVVLVTVGVAAARAAGSLPRELPVPPLLVAAGALAMLVVLVVLIDIPAPELEAVAQDRVAFGREFGIFLALIAAGGIAYGGWRARQGDQAA